MFVRFKFDIIMFYISQHINRVIISKRMRWVGFVAGMGGMGNV
jgi:hypothetical protein